jgi:hypothetical protein
MNENVKWVAAAVGVVGVTVGGILYFSKIKKAPKPVEAPVATVPEPVPEPEAVPEDDIAHPLPQPEANQAMPSLDTSDAPMRAALEDLFGKRPVEQFLVPEDVIRHIVVTVDNLPNEKASERLWPIKRTPGIFTVAGSEDAPVLDPSNYQRYNALVQTVRSTDTKVLVATYVRYYPLFQEAYENLGHPPEYFNDRVIQVIDHLLETPDLEGEVALARPGMRYTYADPELEARSAGQKVLMRMGSANAKAIKDKLRELRTELLAMKPQA